MYVISWFKKWIYFYFHSQISDIFFVLSDVNDIYEMNIINSTVQDL